MTDHVHMKFARILMTILGIWPVKLLGWKLKAYNAYFYISFFYHILYDISQGAMVFISKGSFLETAGNLGVTIVYFLNIYKVLICRSVTLRRIVDDIERKEKMILGSEDEIVKKIYRNYVKSAFVSAVFYMSLGTCGISLYFIGPIAKNLLEQKFKAGARNKYLIFSSWFPFNSDDHYIAAYIIQLFGGFYGYAYIVYAGAFFFCILIYCIGQIMILQHIFKNLSQYAAEFSKTHNIEETRAQEIFTKLCIKEHQHIIGFVGRLDDSIRILLLLEFLISSFQLSLVVYQILQSDGFGVEKVAVCSYLFTLCVQLFLFYWNAHEIIVQSAEIAQAVFESEWTNFNVNVQKMLMFVIMRAQKPIGISIGPIYKVKVDALIGIFKAIYSYVALIQK